MAERLLNFSNSETNETEKGKDFRFIYFQSNSKSFQFCIVL
jgi:hypothetical protein